MPRVLQEVAVVAGHLDDERSSPSPSLATTCSTKRSACSTQLSLKEEKYA